MNMWNTLKSEIYSWSVGSISPTASS